MLLEKKEFCAVVNDITTFHGRVLLNILNVILACVATSGNLLVIIAVIRSRHLRSQAPVYFILSLAMADLLVGSIVQPMFSVILITWSSPICEIEREKTFLAFFTCAISIGASVCVCVDKMLKITKPFSYDKYVTKRKSLAVTMAIWMMGVVIGFLRLIPETKDIIIYGALAEMSTALLIGTYCSRKIYKVGCKHIQGISQHDRIEEKKKILMERRLALSLIAVLIGILICWIPYALVEVCSIYLKNDVNWALFFTIKTWFTLLGYANSTVNIFIFGFKNREVKKAIRNLLNIQPKKRVSTKKNNRNVMKYGSCKRQPHELSSISNGEFKSDVTLHTMTDY